MGGELWGTYDEREAARSFKEAVREWRGGDETTSSASSLSVAYATSASNAALRPSDAGWGQSPQCCWECLTRFTDRGHWSVLARRQFCGKACAATYEKARRLEPPLRACECTRLTVAPFRSVCHTIAVSDRRQRGS